MILLSVGEQQLDEGQIENNTLQDTSELSSPAERDSFERGHDNSAGKNLKTFSLSYPASRGSSIFLDKSYLGRSQGLCLQGKFE